MRTLPNVTLALISATALAHADLIVVDDDDPAEFMEISTAVSFARPGDVILVRPGEYQGFEIVDKRLSVIGQYGIIEVLGPVRLANHASEVVTLTHMSIRAEGTALPALTFEGDGQFRIQDIAGIGASGSTPTAGLRIGTAENVVISASGFYGGDAESTVAAFETPHDGAAGIVVEGTSSVAIYGSVVRGGCGSSLFDPDPYFVAGNGGAGIDYDGAATLLVSETASGPGSAAEGGCGGRSQSLTEIATGGDGGPGLLCRSGSSTVKGISVLHGGSPGLSNNGGHGSYGPSVQLEGGSYDSWFEIPRSALGPSWILSGESAWVEVRGVAGDQVYVVQGLDQAISLDPLLLGAWSIDSPSLPGHYLGTLPASGQFAKLFDVDPISPGESMRAEIQQIHTVDSSGVVRLGPVWLSMQVDNCWSTEFCHGLPNSTGVGAALSFSGSTSVSANDLTLVVQDAPPHQYGIFIMSSSTRNEPFGDGVLCLNVQHRLCPVAQIDASGMASIYVDPSTSPPNISLAPGYFEYLQFWHRDSLAGPGHFNFSGALSLWMCP